MREIAAETDVKYSLFSLCPNLDAIAGGCFGLKSPTDSRRLSHSSYLLFCGDGACLRHPDNEQTQGLPLL
ncbi:hypothetical protein J7M28_07490 [bacterium]|nr:hypothetical protein [bacterium]